MATGDSEASLLVDDTLDFYVMAAGKDQDAMRGNWLTMLEQVRESREHLRKSSRSETVWRQAVAWEPFDHTYRAHVFLMRTLSACLCQPVVTVVLQVTVILSRIDFTHTRGSRA